MKYLLTLLIFLPGSYLPGQSKTENAKLFSKPNLTAWCIVPFDSSKRGPEQRAQMLKELGITRLAYDWREEHVAQFEEELATLQKYQIELAAFWMPYGPDPSNNKHYQAIMDLLKRYHIKTQLWWSYGEGDAAFKRLSPGEKLEVIGKMVRTIAKDAAAIGCTIGLYNHGGWFGEPENELSIISYLNMPNVGIVYNFNHAESQVDRFPQFFPRILPHLIALNIAGLRNGNPGKVVPLGEGDSEQKMIQLIAKSSYNGPIGIINEDTHPDAATGLKMNMEGLKKILLSQGYPVE